MPKRKMLPGQKPLPAMSDIADDWQQQQADDAIASLMGAYRRFANARFALDKEIGAFTKTWGPWNRPELEARTKELFRVGAVELPRIEVALRDIVAEKPEIDESLPF